MHSEPRSAEGWLKRLPGLRAGLAAERRWAGHAGPPPPALPPAPPRSAPVRQLLPADRTPPAVSPASSANAIAWRIARCRSGPQRPRTSPAPPRPATPVEQWVPKSTQPPDVVPVFRRCLKAIAGHQSWYGSLMTFLMKEYELVLQNIAGQDSAPEDVQEFCVDGVEDRRPASQASTPEPVHAAAVSPRSEGLASPLPGGQFTALREQISVLEVDAAAAADREAALRQESAKLREALRQRQARTRDLESDLRETRERALILQSEVHDLTSQLTALRRADEEEQGLVRREFEQRLRAAQISCEEAVTRLGEQAEAREDADRKVELLQEHLKRVTVEADELRKRGRKEDIAEISQLRLVILEEQDLRAQMEEQLQMLVALPSEILSHDGENEAGRQDVVTPTSPLSPLSSTGKLSPRKRKKGGKKSKKQKKGKKG